MGRLLLPHFSLNYCQASLPGLATSELPQPWVNLIYIAVAQSVRGCSVGATTRERRILALAELNKMLELVLPNCAVVTQLILIQK